MKKMWILVIILLIAIIGIVMLYFRNNNRDYLDADSNKINHPELGALSLPKPSSPDFPKVKKKKIQIQKEMQKLNNNFEVDLPEDIRKSVLQSIKNNSLVNDAVIESGFSEKALEKMISTSPDNIISINDMPPEMQEPIREELRQTLENGYEEVEDRYADKIIRVRDYMSDNSEEIPDRINFELSKIPESVSENYKEIGHTFPNAFVSESENGTYDSIRRVFQSNNNDSQDLLIIEETSLQSGSANLISEFVNSSVNEYPAIYSIKTTQDGESYAMLNWTTQGYAYSLYQGGTINDDTPKVLNSIARSITEVNTTNNSEREQQTPDFDDLPPEL